MDQQVYTYMKMLQQNPSDDHMQQQQIQTQGLTLACNDQSQQEVIVQDDPSQQQHLIYSPLKPEQSQQYAQDESMQNHYLIQTQGQQTYYYSMSPGRLPPMQQQQIAHNPNLISQGQNQQEVTGNIFSRN